MRAKSFSAERKGTEQWKSRKDEWGLKTNKGEKWKTTVQQAFSPVYRKNTAALLYCLALLLGPDRPFNAVEPSVRGCHQKKSTGDQRTVGQGRASVRGHNQLEHLELRAGTQKTHTPMLTHKHSYTHEMTMWRHTRTSFLVYLLAHEQAMIIWVHMNAHMLHT